MTDIINLTPHDINIASADGSIIRTITPTEPPARVSVTTEEIGRIDGIPLRKTVYGDVENLPEPQPFVYYIVSGIVMSALPDRADLVRPDTGPTCIRDENNRIIAVRALTR